MIATDVTPVTAVEFNAPRSSLLPIYPHNGSLRDSRDSLEWRIDAARRPGYMEVCGWRGARGRDSRARVRIPPH